MLKVRKFNHFNSLIYNSKTISKNTIIYKLSGIILDKPTRTSIQITEQSHIEDNFGRYMNHSCNPNCKIEHGCIVSLCNIMKGNEITFDYTKNETHMASPFYCFCCNKLIKGKS